MLSGLQIVRMNWKDIMNIFKWFKKEDKKEQEYPDIFKYTDMIEVGLTCGKCGYKTKYLFLGKYVNRKKFYCCNCEKDEFEKTKK